MVGAMLALLTGCAAPHNPYYDPAKPHHTPQGFRNHEPFAPRGLDQLLRWKFDQLRHGKPDAASGPTPQVAPDLAFLQANARAGAAMQPSLTWIGHSTMLVQMGGLNLLVDPIFSDRAGPLNLGLGPKRLQPPGVAMDQLPRIDAVLVSHNHYDHLDAASVRALHAQPGGPPTFIVPLGIGPWLAAEGIPGAIELDWWQTHALQGSAGAVEVVLTPAQHWSARGLTDRLQTLWGGFAVFAPELHLLYTGDTGYSADFRRIRERFRERQGAVGFDVALIPIGAYEPRWFMREQHVNPEEAIRIHQDVGAQRSVGVHWGTFSLADEAPDHPPRELAEARRRLGVADEAFSVMAIGETRRLPARPHR